jgi:hypothetical protein
MVFDGRLEPGSEFRWKAGPGTIVSTLEQVEPPRFVRWRGRTMSIAALHAWRVEPQGAGTAVETEESFSGLLARLFRRPLQKTLDKSLRPGPRAPEARGRATRQRLTVALLDARIDSRISSRGGATAEGEDAC